MPSDKRKRKAAATEKERQSVPWARMALAATVALVAVAAALVGRSGAIDESFTIDGVCGRQGCHNVPIKVHSISNFFPAAQARAWRDAMERSWAQRENSGWLYTTNNDGSDPRNINAKVRSLDKVDARRGLAHRMDAAGYFAYSKWELDASHAVVRGLLEYFEEPLTAERVAASVNANALAPGLSDLFVTHYAAGDFLSMHNDGFSGTWAVVVSLSSGPEWQPGFGGELCFQCARAAVSDLAHKRSWCQCVPPRFNTALIFKTRVGRETGEGGGPYHKVMPVTELAATAGWKRFGITGWYNEMADEWSEQEKLENARMRGKVD